MFAEIINKKSITDRDTLYTFWCPEIAKSAKPGQFVEVKLSSGSTDPFLRRPISIFDCDKETRFSLLVRRVGGGTEKMEALTTGSMVDILGPLGNGFTIRDEDKTVLVIGGGIGVAPVYYLMKELFSQGKKICFLFSPEREIQILEAFPENDFYSLIKSKNRNEIPVKMQEGIKDSDCIYACGPEGMLETVAQIANNADVPCQLSMERRMGCGFGICVCCAIPVYTDNGLIYKKVCLDGPVFSAKEVSFHELP